MEPDLVGILLAKKLILHWVGLVGP